MWRTANCCGPIRKRSANRRRSPPLAGEDPRGAGDLAELALLASLPAPWDQGRLEPLGQGPDQRQLPALSPHWESRPSCAAVTRIRCALASTGPPSGSSTRGGGAGAGVALSSRRSRHRPDAAGVVRRTQLGRAGAASRRAARLMADVLVRLHRLPVPTVVMAVRAHSGGYRQRLAHIPPGCPPWSGPCSRAGSRTTAGSLAITISIRLTCWGRGPGSSTGSTAPPVILGSRSPAFQRTTAGAKSSGASWRAAILKPWTGQRRGWGPGIPGRCLPALGRLHRPAVGAADGRTATRARVSGPDRHQPPAPG